MPGRSNSHAAFLSRRRFVESAGFALLSPFNNNLKASIPDSPQVLRGDRFELVIDWLSVDYTGRQRQAAAVNGTVPGPTLRWREGDTVTISVVNRLPVPTSIHWHGIRCPSDMDGVPGLSFAGIPPGETFVYRIPVRQHGTYWYHSHSHFQEQIGLYGSLVIEPAGQAPVQSDCDYVVMLSDWTDEDPNTVFGNLKKQSDYYNYRERTAGTFIKDARDKGLRATISDRLAWGRANMSPTDIADVTGATYTLFG